MVVWILGEMEDVEWMHENDVDTAGMDIPGDGQTSGLPFVDDDNINTPWDWFDVNITHCYWCNKVWHTLHYSIWYSVFNDSIKMVICVAMHLCFVLYQGCISFLLLAE